MTRTEKMVLAGLAALFALGLALRLWSGSPSVNAAASLSVPSSPRPAALRPKKRVPAAQPAKRPGKKHPHVPLDINRASAKELEKLPGIGPAFAARIAGHRDRHGRFKEKSDLLKVPGVSVTLYLRLEALIACPP